MTSTADVSARSGLARALSRVRQPLSQPSDSAEQNGVTLARLPSSEERKRCGVTVNEDYIKNVPATELDDSSGCRELIQADGAPACCGGGWNDNP